MKALTEPSISFDRISTREELDQVLHLLSDVDTSEGRGIALATEPADSLLGDWPTELEENLNEGQGKKSQSREKRLMTLLLQMDERAN
jgi:hypothetical protein